MCEEMKWIYVLALKAEAPIGLWIGPSDTVVEFFNTRIELGKLYHFVVDNHIDFDPNGGTVR